jgi:hypothetical protein
LSPVLIILVVLIVVAIVFSAVLAILVLPLITGPGVLTPPTVTLNPVGLGGGNATIDVASVSASSPIGLFEVNLAVDGSSGSPQSIEPPPAYAVVIVSGQRYRITWTSAGDSSFLGTGDRFRVSGDGSALPSGRSFKFSLIWRISGTLVASATWPPAVAKPIVTFSAVSQDGNATLSIAGASQSVAPGNYRVNLQAGPLLGTAIAMPTISGGFANVVINGTTYRIYWTDIGGEGTLSPGDIFRITGNGVRLPVATEFVFYLLWSDGSSIRSASWSTS